MTINDGYSPYCMCLTWGVWPTRELLSKEWMTSPESRCHICHIVDCVTRLFFIRFQLGSIAQNTFGFRHGQRWELNTSSSRLNSCHKPFFSVSNMSNLPIYVIVDPNVTRIHSINVFQSSFRCILGLYWVSLPLLQFSQPRMAMINQHLPQHPVNITQNE